MTIVLAQDNEEIEEERAKTFYRTKAKALAIASIEMRLECLAFSPAAQQEASELRDILETIKRL